MFVLWQLPSLTALIIAACVFGFCYGANLVLLPTIIGNYYSPSAFASVNGFMFPFQFGLASLTPVLAGYVYDITKSYDWAYIVVLLLLTVAFICAYHGNASIKVGACEKRLLLIIHS